MVQVEGVTIAEMHDDLKGHRISVDAREDKMKRVG